MRPGSKDALVRLATLDGAVVVDANARLQGRGGYLHPTHECIERFVNSKVRVFRSLKRRIDLSERRAVVETLRERLE